LEKNHRKKIKAAKKTAGKIAKSASAKKNALAMKKAGKGIFAKKVLSPALAAICGAKSLPRTEAKDYVFSHSESERILF
jgi:chromatin remodeling complex protein RSC6